MPKVNLQYQVDLNTLMSFCKEEKKEKKKKKSTCYMEVRSGGLLKKTKCSTIFNRLKSDLKQTTCTGF